MASMDEANLSLSFSREELSLQPINSLRKMASRMSISAAGKKADIVERLVGWDQSQHQTIEEEDGDEEGEEPEALVTEVWLGEPEDAACWRDVNSPMVAGTSSPRSPVPLRTLSPRSSPNLLPSTPAILAKLLSPAKVVSPAHPKPQPQQSSPARPPTLSRAPLYSKSDADGEPLSCEQLQATLQVLQRRLASLCADPEADASRLANADEGMAAVLARTARSLGVDERLRLIIRPPSIPSPLLLPLPAGGPSTVSSPVPRPDASVAALLAARATPTGHTHSPARSPARIHSPLRQGQSPLRQGPAAGATRYAKEPPTAPVPAPTPIPTPAPSPSPALVSAPVASPAPSTAPARATASVATPSSVLRRPASATTATPTRRREVKAPPSASSASAAKPATPAPTPTPTLVTASPRSVTKLAPSSRGAAGGSSSGSSSAAARKALVDASKTARLAATAASATASAAAPSTAAARKALLEASRLARAKAAPAAPAAAAASSSRAAASSATPSRARPIAPASSAPATPSAVKRGAGFQTPSRAAGTSRPAVTPSSKAAATPSSARPASARRPIAAVAASTVSASASKASAQGQGQGQGRAGAMAAPVGSVRKAPNTSTGSAISASSAASASTPSRMLAQPVQPAAINPFAFAELH